MPRKLYRSRTDKVIAGVCGGLGEYFDIDPVIIRLIWAVLVFVYGFGLLAYIICWIVIPLKPEGKKKEKSKVKNKEYEERSKMLLGVALILFGVLIVLNNLGVFLWLRWDWWYFWPTALIIIGFLIILMREKEK